MTEILRVLLVDDSEDDAALIERELRRAGHRPLACRVVDEGGMRAALDASAWDVVLCDSSMPGFSATKAAALLEEKGATAPLILVSGSPPSPSRAHLATQHPFVPKSELWRLAGVVEAELEEGALGDIDNLVTRAGETAAWGKNPHSVADRIADELNRMVAIIASSSAALRTQVSLQDPSRRHVDDAERAVLRATELILDAFAFCRSRDEVLHTSRESSTPHTLPPSKSPGGDPCDEILEAASLVRLNLEFVWQVVHGEPRAALHEARRALERLTECARAMRADEWDDKTPRP